MKKKRDKVRTYVRLVEDKAFWLGVASVLIILSSIWLMDYSDNLVGREIQKISYLQPGIDIILNIKEVDGLEVTKLKFAETVNDVMVKIEELPRLDYKFEGITYSQFKVSFTNGAKLDQAKFTLKLKETKLTSLGLAKDQVRMYLGNKELKTKFIKSESFFKSQEKFSYYEVVTSEIGNFVIGKAATKKPALVGKAEQKPAVQKPTVVKTPVIEEKKLEDKLPPIMKKQEPAPKKEETRLSKLITYIKSWFN